MLEGFYIAVVMSMIMGSVLLPYMYAKKEEDVMTCIIKIYIKLVIVLFIILAILFFFSTTLEAFSTHAFTLHTINILGFCMMLITIVAFACSYLFSLRLCAKRLKSNHEEN